MESFIRPPDPLKDNKPETWVIWKEEFLIFMNLLGYMNRPQHEKARLFKNRIGSIGVATINKLSFEHIQDKDNLDILLQKLDHYYNPQHTEAHKRYIFFTTSKKRDETIENYIQKLKELALACNFGNMTDSLVRDVIILHAHDKILRQKYLENEKLDFTKIIEIYKNHKILELQKTSNVNPFGSQEQYKKKELLTKHKEFPNVASGSGNCWRCYTKHPIKECPAWNYKCTKCNKLHHFEKCCKEPLQSKGHVPNMNDLNIDSEKLTVVKDKKTLYNFNKNIQGK